MSNCWEATRLTDIWRWWSLLEKLLNSQYLRVFLPSLQYQKKWVHLLPQYLHALSWLASSSNLERDKAEQEILLSHNPFGFALTLQILPFWFWSLFYCIVFWKFQTEASSTRRDLSVFHRKYFCLPLALLGALRDEVARLSQLLAEERRLVASLEAEIVELVHGRKLQGNPYSTYVHK